MFCNWKDTPSPGKTKDLFSLRQNKPKFFRPLPPGGGRGSHFLHRPSLDIGGAL